MDKKNSGFTLVETVVVLAVTSILLSLLLPNFLSIGRIYRETASANLIQAKASHAMDFVRDSVQNATEVQIINGEINLLDTHSAIWCKDNKLYYQIDGREAAVYMQDTSFTLDFNGNGQRLGIKLQVLTDGEPYTLETAIAIHGMSAVAEQSGTGIRFKTIP